MKCCIHKEIELEEVWYDRHRPDFICFKCVEEFDKRRLDVKGRWTK